jgi:hypothetical protein
MTTELQQAAEAAAKAKEAMAKAADPAEVAEVARAKMIWGDEAWDEAARAVARTVPPGGVWDAVTWLKANALTVQQKAFDSRTGK